MSYIGLSFPIRLGSRGGLRLSSSANLSNERISEIIQLTLGTDKYERLMHPDLGSDIDTEVYENGDLSAQSLIQYEIATALNKDSRIRIQPTDIKFITDPTDGNITYIDVMCLVEGDIQSYRVPINIGR